MSIPSRPADIRSIALAAFGVALAMAAGAPHAASGRPPTLDPTFGRKAPPPPRRAQPSGKGAAWIWTAATRDNQTIAARREFQLDVLPKRAVLYITADNAFTAYLNGRPVGRSDSGPDGFAWRQVKTFPALGPLKRGANTLDIQAHNDSGPGGVVAALVMSSTGPPREIVTDASWRVKDSPPAGWESSSSGDGWSPAAVEAPLGSGQWTGLQGWPGLSESSYLRRMTVLPSAVLEVRPGQGGIRGETTLLKAEAGAARLTITPAPPGTADSGVPSLTADFGREITGRVEIESASGAPATVVLSYGESQDEADFGPFGGAQRLELPPHGTAMGRDSAFRYAKVAFPVAGRPLQIRSIRCGHLYYPVEYRGSFASSDPLLDRIWYTGAYTCHLCMQEDIWDAPKRDRARWMGDLQVSGEVINDAFLDRFLMEQTMDRLRADAGDPPHSHVNGIPGYSCAWVVGAADFYRHTGDLAWIKRHHDDLIGLMDYFHGELDDRGVFANKRGQWPFVDWSPNFNGQDPHALRATHFYMVRMLNDGAWLLDEMGDHMAAQRYYGWAKQATDAAQRYLLDPATGTFGDRWQENAMAIYSGVATPEQRKVIWERVLSRMYPVEQMITPYYNNYSIFAMAMAGHSPDALRFIRDYWGGMIREGATSFWEGYDTRWPKEHFHRYLQADNGMGYFVSLSHGWSAGATAWLTEEVLGVRPTAAGFGRMEIRPQLADLSWAKGAVPTPHGPVEVSYQKQKGRWTATVHLPPNTQAVVGLPGRPDQRIGPGAHHL